MLARHPKRILQDDKEMRKKSDKTIPKKNQKKEECQIEIESIFLQSRRKKMLLKLTHTRGALPDKRSDIAL